jgi:hypothetical protein
MIATKRAFIWYRLYLLFYKGFVEGSEIVASIGVEVPCACPIGCSPPKVRNDHHSRFPQVVTTTRQSVPNVPETIVVRISNKGRTKWQSMLCNQLLWTAKWRITKYYLERLVVPSVFAKKPVETGTCTAVWHRTCIQWSGDSFFSLNKALFYPEFV